MLPNKKKRRSSLMDRKPKEGVRALSQKTLSHDLNAAHHGLYLPRAFTTLIALWGKE